MIHFGLLGLVLSGVLTVAGHFDTDPGLSPWAHTISDFAAADRGGAVEFAMALAAVSTVALLPYVRRAVAVLLGLWTAGLLVAAIVPTDPVGQSLSTAGYVHRYASAAAFVALLGAGVLLARGSERTIRWLTALGGLGGVAMLASTYVFDRVAIGLTERVLAAAGLGVLIQVALQQVTPRWAVALTTV